MRTTKSGLICAAIGALGILVASACGGGGETGSGGSAGSHGEGVGAAPGGSGPNGGGGDGSGNGGGGPVTPTASTWLGTNVDVDLPRVDVAYQLKPFDGDAADKDENGYPKAGKSGKSSTDAGFLLPSGTYTLAFKGDGTLAVSGIGQIMGGFTTKNGEHRAKIQITGTPGTFGNFLTLQITNTGSQTVTGVRLLMPGHDPDDPAIFLPEFLRLLKPFRAMRFMGWFDTNGSKLADWADRPRAAQFGANANGQPYEHVVALINETGKDGWINVPELATDEFVKQLAQYFAKNLDFEAITAARRKQGINAPFRLIVEFSNETWNTGFSAYAALLKEAQANPSRFTGTYDGAYPSFMSSNAALMSVGQVEGDHLAKIAKAFQGAFGDHADAVAPVLSGWALAATYSDVALRFIKDNYGDPKKYVHYVATAPYFGVQKDPDDTGSLDAIFTSMNANIDGMDPTFLDFKKLVGEYGLEIAAYEGGQGLSGTANEPLKHLAQHDARMYAAYERYFTLWKKDFGEATFMNFDLAGIPGQPENIYQYGFWGSIIGVMEDPSACGKGLLTLTGTEMIADVVHHCPKYESLQEKVPK